MPTYSLGFCLWNLASEGFPNPEYLELTWHNLPLHHLEFDRLSSLPPSLPRMFRAHSVENVAHVGQQHGVQSDVRSRLAPAWLLRLIAELRPLESSPALTRVRFFDSLTMSQLFESDT